MRKQNPASADPLHPKRDKKKPHVPTAPPKRPQPHRPPPPPKDMKLGPPAADIDPASLSMPPIMSRPGFLPNEGGAANGNGIPFLRAPSGVGLPVIGGLPPAPAGKPPGIGGFGMSKPPPGVPPLQGMPGTGTPGRGGSMLGQAGGAGLMPGKLGRSPGMTPPGMATPPAPGTPTLGMSGTFGQTPPPPWLPPGKAGMPPSPSGSVGSHLSKSLSEKMAAKRGGAPPPPPGARGATPPGSHRSAGGGAKPPPGPPPAGQSSLEKSRSAKRGQ